MLRGFLSQGPSSRMCKRDEGWAVLEGMGQSSQASSQGPKGLHSVTASPATPGGPSTVRHRVWYYYCHLTGETDLTMVFLTKTQ